MNLGTNYITAGIFRCLIQSAILQDLIGQIFATEKIGFHWKNARSVYIFNLVMRVCDIPRSVPSRHFATPHA